MSPEEPVPVWPSLHTLDSSGIGFLVALWCGLLSGFGGVMGIPVSSIGVYLIFIDLGIFKCFRSLSASHSGIR